MDALSLNSLSALERELEMLLTAVRGAKAGAVWELARLDPYLSLLDLERPHLHVPVTRDIVHAVMSACNDCPSAPGSYPESER